ncbi:PssD/Cps14F family polysaccharide biosynthesis glycosyltransferase [Anaerorhabdus sp.]|jgi:beta-1,4-N-acetylglucosaminyltransferase|uniref:PssD/Cps14F family polysaccharide biosynthesis glycosyltransferase n=1 Tax=Anaerorhabdus sp. TaxID=1872524 RepID=UPI002FC69157
MKKVIFISSTGGHLTELMQLVPMFEKVDYTLITENTSSNKSLKDTYGDKFTTLAYGTKQHLLPYLFIFSYNILKSFFLFMKIRPDYIITTGTHTAVPLCKIAHIFKKKVIYIETFANSKTPTKAGQMIYPIADLFIVQWESMLAVYPNAVYGGWIF